MCTSGSPAHIKPIVNFNPDEVQEDNCVDVKKETAVKQFFVLNSSISEFSHCTQFFNMAPELNIH